MHPNMKMHFYQITLTAKTSRPGFTWLLKELKLRSIDLDCVTKKGKMKQKLKKQGGAQKFWRWVFFSSDLQTNWNWNARTIPINKTVERSCHPKRRINNKSNTFWGKLQQNGWMVFFKEMQVMKGKLPLPAKMQAGRMLQTLIAFSYKGKKCFHQQIYCGIQDWTTVSIAVLSRVSLAQSSVF